MAICFSQPTSFHDFHLRVDFQDTLTSAVAEEKGGVSLHGSIEWLICPVNTALVVLLCSTHEVNSKTAKQQKSKDGSTLIRSRKANHLHHQSREIPATPSLLLVGDEVHGINSC